MRDRFGREHPDPSMWAMVANKVMFHLAYLDSRRGFVPLGNPLMWRLLDAKRDFVQMAEQAEVDGTPMPQTEFIAMCKEGFEKVLGSQESAAASRAA